MIEDFFKVCKKAYAAMVLIELPGMTNKRYSSSERTISLGSNKTASNLSTSTEALLGQY